MNIEEKAPKYTYKANGSITDRTSYCLKSRTKYDRIITEIREQVMLYLYLLSQG